MTSSSGRNQAISGQLRHMDLTFHPREADVNVVNLFWFPIFMIKWNQIFRADMSLLVMLTFGFIIATFAGTVLHESAHYLAARCFGQNARIHFSSTSLLFTEQALSQAQRFLITLAGPLQTMLTGITGLWLLYLNRNSYDQSISLTGKQWFHVFLAMFWLRQLFIFLSWLFKIAISGSSISTVDEIRIARYLGWPDNVVVVSTGIAGLIIVLLVTFRFIPANQRSTFILAGFTGCLAGYFSWMHWLGRLVLP